MSLITKKEVERFRKEMSPEGFVGLSEQNRGTGRTTRLAMMFLLDALGNPGKLVYTGDHHFTKGANENLLHVMQEITKRLELERLKFDRHRMTVVFDWVNPWEEKS